MIETSGVVIKNFLFLGLIFFFANSCQDDFNDIKELNAFENNGQIIENDIRFLALGDSYSVGEGLEDQKNWPERLFDSLKKNEDDLFTIIGETGFSTSELTLTFENTILEKPYNLISIQIGVNDQFRGTSSTIFKEDFQGLLKRIKENKQTRNASIFVVSIPDWSSTPFGADWDRSKITKEIDEYNTVLKQICNLNNLLFIDITKISRSDPNNWAYVTPDGLHPSALMYGLWLDEIYSLVKRLLNSFNFR